MDARGVGESALLNNIGSVGITTPGDRHIVITRLFDAPRSLVFEAWTKVEHVRHWWDPSGVPLAVCEIDRSSSPRVGFDCIYANRRFLMKSRYPNMSLIVMSSTCRVPSCWPLTIRHSVCRKSIASTLAAASSCMCGST